MTRTRVHTPFRPLVFPQMGPDALPKLVLHHWLSGTSEWGVVQKQSAWGLDLQASETRL